MADAPKEEKKVETSFDYKPLFKFIFWILSGLFILTLIYVVILQNEQTVLNFIYFLNGLQILLGFYLIFLFYKLHTYIERHKYWGNKIGEWYGKKYKPDVKNTENDNPNRTRFEKAKMHIASEYKEEWKIGIIELDNILRDLLKGKGYIGETVAELLDDGAKKGMITLDKAWEAHRVRNRVVHEGMNYDFPKEQAERTLRNYSSVFEELGI